MSIWHTQSSTSFTQQQRLQTLLACRRKAIRLRTAAGKWPTLSLTTQCQHQGCCLPRGPHASKGMCTQRSALQHAACFSRTPCQRDWVLQAPLRPPLARVASKGVCTQRGALASGGVCVGHTHTAPHLLQVGPVKQASRRGGHLLARHTRRGAEEGHRWGGDALRQWAGGKGGGGQEGPQAQRKEQGLRGRGGGRPACLGSAVGRWAGAKGGCR